MERAITALRTQGKHIPDDLLRYLAPLGWQHINLTGDYLWGADRQVAPAGFRPLRTSSDLLAA